MAGRHSKASASWEGNLLHGEGVVSTASGTLDDVAVSWSARTGESGGTSPEELLAAAHAACFSMAFSAALTDAGYEPESIETKAVCSFEPKPEGGYGVTKMQLEVEAHVEGIENEKFQEIAEDAKESCPISQALSVPISLKAKLFVLTI